LERYSYLKEEKDSRGGIRRGKTDDKKFGSEINKGPAYVEDEDNDRCSRGPDVNKVVEKTGGKRRDYIDPGSGERDEVTKGDFTVLKEREAGKVGLMR